MYVAMKTQQRVPFVLWTCMLLSITQEILEALPWERNSAYYLLFSFICHCQQYEHLGLHVNCPPPPKKKNYFFFSNFNQFLIFLTDFQKVPNIKFQVN